MTTHTMNSYCNILDIWCEYTYSAVTWAEVKGTHSEYDLYGMTSHPCLSTFGAPGDRLGDVGLGDIVTERPRVTDCRTVMG
jgi:hypothetical protein